MAYLLSAPEQQQQQSGVFGLGVWKHGVFCSVWFLEKFIHNNAHKFVVLAVSNKMDQKYHYNINNAQKSKNCKIAIS
ncbi:hypothetical protein STEG23_009282, partial [Scotinomys teguina]